MKKKIIMVFKTHFDIGFTDLSENIIKKYAGPMLDEVVDTCKATENMGELKYVWTMPSWPLKITRENSEDEKRGTLDELVKNGQIAWHALPFTSHFDFCGLEDTIYGLKYAKELSKFYGKPRTITAKMTDVPGHGAMLPAVLKTAGIEFLHLGCNEFATPPDVPPLFFWEAPDGSKVLTMYCRGGYGSPLLPPPTWEFPVWMALMHTHDNCGPQSAEIIKKLTAEAHENCPDAEIICGTMDDFYTELKKYDLSSVPVVKKDLADSWIHGVGSYPSEVSTVRRTRKKLIRAQKYFALQEMKNGLELQKREKFQSLCDKAYENLVLFGEHTWGLDVKTWMNSERAYDKKSFTEMKKSEEYRNMEKSWQEQRDRALAVSTFTDEACSINDNDENSISVFNPTGSNFTGWAFCGNDNVILEKSPCPVCKINGKTAVYVENLLPLSCEKLDLNGKTQPMSQLKINREGDTITAQNHRYKLFFSNENGEIASVNDLKTGKTLLSKREGMGVFSYRYDVYGSHDMTEYLRNYAYRFSDWGIKDNGRENYPECKTEHFEPIFDGWSVENSTLSFNYHTNRSNSDYGDAEKIVLEITMPPKGNEIFVSLHLKNKAETPFVESGTFCIPLTDNKPCYTLNKNGCTINPETDIVDCANHALYALEAFARTDDVCVIPMDTPLMAIGETGIYAFRKKYEEHEPILEFNLFNNMWGTNFPQWFGGDFRFDFVLFGCEGEKKDINRRAFELYEGAYVGNLKETEPMFSMSEDVRILNLYPSGKGSILRLQNLANEKLKVESKEDLAFEPMNLQEESIGERQNKIFEGSSLWKIHTVFCSK